MGTLGRARRARGVRPRSIDPGELRGRILDLLPTSAATGMTSGVTIRSAPGVGRNEPCPCGSGRKFKKCCMDKQAEVDAEPSPEPGVRLGIGHRILFRFEPERGQRGIEHRIARRDLDRFLGRSVRANKKRPNGRQQERRMPRPRGVGPEAGFPTWGEGLRSPS